MKRTYILHIKTPKGVKRYDTANKSRFFNHTRLINWEIKVLRVYLKVSDGKREDHRGKMVEFYNDGMYTDKHNFLLAFRAFTE